MTIGADKIVSFDPPGAIGLPAADAVVLLRFDEELDEVFPKDAAGVLDDLQVVSPLTTPPVGEGAVGRARLFAPTDSTGLVATDLLPATSLLTRDATIQVIVKFNVGAQDLVGAGSIIARGKGTASAEYLAYGLEIEVLEPDSRLCQIYWAWQDISGVEKLQAPVELIVPVGFTMLTATRRWVSPTKVVLRYYIGDVLLGENESADGSIGGGTTGTFQVGTRFNPGGGVFARFLAGAIDEVLVLDRELTLEEIASTWQRITVTQPLGYQLMRELHDPGFPLPSDPGSDVQLDLRMTGNALGYAAALAEDVRSNILPQRAYGSVLEDWEETVRVTPQPSDGTDERRARVVAKIRQRRGCSIPGIEDALPGLLGDGTSDDLEFLAFSNEIDDDFSAIDPLRWDASSYAAITSISGAASFQPGGGTFIMNGFTRDWLNMRQVVGGDGKQARQLVKLVFTTPQNTAEAGVYFENAITHDYLLLGLRDVAGSFKVETESFINGVSQGVVVQATIGANPAAIWLHLFQTTTDGTWKAAWSTTSGTTGFTVSADITHPTTAHWAGLYLRSTGAIAAPRADFDDHRLFMPFSGRPFNAYVLLDRALGFSPDIDGANSVISAIKHGFTHAAFITNPVLLSDDPDGGAGVAPTGGY